MKKIVLSIMSLILVVAITGCGTTYTAYNNVMKLKKRTSASINLQTTAPDIKSLAQYAMSPLARDLQKSLDMYVTDPDSIPTKIMDPATNPEAAKQVEKDIKEARRGMAKSFKGTSRAQAAQIMNSVVKNMRKPYWLITDLPTGAFEGVVRSVEHVSTGTIKMKDGKSVYYRFDYETKGIETVRAELIAALDEFLTKDGKWVKKADVRKNSYASAKETIQDSIVLYKKMIADIEKYPERKADVDRYKRDLKKNENMLAYYNKMEAKKESPITMYTYMWNAAGKIDLKNHANMLTVVLNIKDGNVTLAFNTIEYE
ncbi:MAG: hypothetical protein C0603_00830 [Denitrovibrio sp.]|nr:MAG: hypothetical protein C0603_00830 [Denitrovibrio sp.]